MKPPLVSVIMPVLNEAAAIEQRLAEFASDQQPYELIIVDGGSTDATRQIVRGFIDTRPAHTPDAPGPPIRLLASAPGRAQQMNRGAAVARGNVLLFLHADTRLPPMAIKNIEQAMLTGCLWGRFDVKLYGKHWRYRVIERAMNRRSVLTGIATGDQAMFVRRDLFRMLDGFARVPLMEDIELSKRLKGIDQPARIRERVTTSVRRWEQNGVLRTVWLMWTLRLLYWVGVAPRRLARWYQQPR